MSLADDWTEIMDLRQDRMDEHHANNPGRRACDTWEPVKIEYEKIVWTCQHWQGCDHVLDGSERFPGWLCDEHYTPENKKWIWLEKETRG